MKNSTLLKISLCLWFAVAGIVVITGCARLKPGADPLIVRVEQFETVATSTFRLVLSTDQLDRGFWRTNAPAFHEFCETLRKPVLYTNTVPPALLPQYRVALLSLDDVKNTYSAARTEGNSNALFTTLITLQALQNQAGFWLNTVTNK